MKCVEQQYQDEIDEQSGHIAEAASHLRVALLQAHPDDDQIILEHVREALKLLEEQP